MGSPSLLDNLAALRSITAPPGPFLDTAVRGGLNLLASGKTNRWIVSQRQPRSDSVW